MRSNVNEVEEVVPERLNDNEDQAHELELGGEELCVQEVEDISDPVEDSNDYSSHYHYFTECELSAGETHNLN